MGGDSVYVCLCEFFGSCHHKGLGILGCYKHIVESRIRYYIIFCRSGYRIIVSHSNNIQAPLGNVRLSGYLLCYEVLQIDWVSDYLLKCVLPKQNCSQYQNEAV